MRCPTGRSIVALGLALAALSIPAGVLGAQAPAKVAASLRRIFGVDARAVAIPVGGGADTVLRVVHHDSLLGFALIRNVIGKDQPITFLVATDIEDRLKDIDVLVYREPYGGEVAYEAWRRRFRGKSVSDPIQVGRDIPTISGATISVNAVTLGVRRALAQLTDWRKSGVIR